MDYAVIQTGGKQYVVKPGEELKIEKIPGAEEGCRVLFKDVRLVRQGDKLHVGAPRVPGAVVSADVLALEKGEKIIVYKKKRRKGYNKKRGHRQQLCRVRIDKIDIQ